MTERKENELVIGSRESALAVVQSGMVRDYILKHCPGMTVDILKMKTTGDRILDRRLDQIGGKGLFVKELDLALRDGRSDISVHSLKDMPMEVPDDLPLIAYSKREDPRDVLVLPAGADPEAGPDFSKPVGTSSLRRIIQLEKLFPEARFESVRGNLQTRLRKLDEGRYGCIILAAAGMKRMGLGDRISRYFSADEVIPAAGQGIMAVQGRAGEEHPCLDGFQDMPSAMAAVCERAFVRELDGGCSSPVAAHAEIAGNKYTDSDSATLRAGDQVELCLRGLYYDTDTKAWERRTVTENVLFGDLEACGAFGIRLAKELREAVSGSR